MSTKPRATNAYIMPTSKPLTNSSSKNSMVAAPLHRGRAHVFHRPDRKGVFDLRPPAILIGDDGFYFHFRLVGIEGVDDVAVFLGDKASPHLAGAGHLLIVRIQLLVEQHIGADARRRWQADVH